MKIRPEATEDHAVVHDLNLSAFETATEADLVDALRAQADPVISLVAEDDGDVVAHIFFSPVTLSTEPQLKVMGLAPMAVVPARQRRGIGSQLVRAGLEQCKVMGYNAVVVIGHPQYYPRFGFIPASRFDIGCEYEVPDEVFMATELVPGALDGKSGVVKYHPAFSDA